VRSPSTPFDFRALLECRVTTTVLVASITLSVLRLSGSDMDALIAQSDTWKPHPWTLVTSTLLHASYMHLAFNAYWTARFGVAVESAFGALAMAGFLLLFAVCSSAPQVAVAGGGIGLSGVGYALFGFLWTLSRFDRRYRGCLDERTTMLFVVWFVFCIVLSATGAMPIGNIAHGSGLVVGAATGWAVADTSRTVVARATPLFIVLSAVVLTCTILQPWLQSPRARLVELDMQANKALQDGDNARAERLLAEVVALDPKDSWAWWGLGCARWRLGEYDEAVAACERVEALGSLSPEQRKFLGEARAWRDHRPRASAPAK
jgi:GlpG protein